MIILSSFYCGCLGVFNLLIMIEVFDYYNYLKREGVYLSFMEIL